MLREDAWKIKAPGKGRPSNGSNYTLRKTQESVAKLTTDSSVGDPTAFPMHFHQANRRVKQVIADGACEGGETRKLIQQQGVKALVAPPKNGVCNGIDEDRDRAILDIRIFGGDKTARSIWGK